jgi:hypothetical protein
MGNAPANVIRSNLAMTVDPNDDFSPCLPQGYVQTGGHDFAGVVDDLDIAQLSQKPSDEFSRRVLL